MATITLKNIPDDLYERLKAAAKAHHRSINSELIHCLEQILKPKPISPEDRLARLRSIRPRIPADAVSPEEILKAISETTPLFS
ncbi:antitoxin FitA [Methylomarinovum tepidoasis]|uniref:Antitoxin FitA n=1 Tax=Methylomarinovum tepidoasis TaxID=2840183 RepID=A0AAU9CFR2_9GAMM|nr:Arc family DNA-binding protein [Methylomarinovum sp. IN45]BCX89671.1 antitoxin FitA [Methylomarinovum sp. IN45]